MSGTYHHEGQLRTSSPFPKRKNTNSSLVTYFVMGNIHNG